MEKIEQLFTDDSSPWLEALPNYQKGRVEQLLKSGGSLEDVAKQWLSADVKQTVAFGADKGKNLFIDKVWEEIEKFLCGSDAYESDRERIGKESNIIHTYFVGVVSAAIAPSLGTSSIFLAPVVALLLASLGKISINAWCQMRVEQRVKKPEKET